MSERQDDPAGADLAVEDQVGFKLRRAMQRYSAISADLLPDALTGAQLSVLSKLMVLGACSQNALGRETAMDAANIKDVVDRLVQRGLAEKHADPHDRRRKVLNLTETGRALTVNARQALTSIGEKFLRSLNENEKRRFLSILDKLG